jgi:hypothetical protein
MTLTSDQIAEIERLIDRLKKWQNGDMPRTIKDYSRYSQLIRFVEPQANIVLMSLSAVMPETVRLVHVKLQELLRKASQVDSLKQEDKDGARLEDSSLQRLARDFVLTLEPMVKNAGQEKPVPDEPEQNLTDIEKLARKAGHPYNFKFKSSLSALRKRGILGNKSPGYFLESEYEFLLKKSD